MFPKCGLVSRVSVVIGCSIRESCGSTVQGEKLNIGTTIIIADSSTSNTTSFRSPRTLKSSLVVSGGLKLVVRNLFPVLLEDLLHIYNVVLKTLFIMLARSKNRKLPSGFRPIAPVRIL